MKSSKFIKATTINKYSITIENFGIYKVKEVNVFKALQSLQEKLNPLKSESCKDLLIVSSAFVHKQNTLVDITSLFN